MQSRLKEAVVLAIAILGLGAFIYSSVNNVKERDRVITVRGLAEREVPADYVIYPIVFKHMGNDLPTLYTEIQNRTDAITKFLVDNGIDKSEITYAAPDIEDLEGNVYENRKITSRYNATVAITVASNKVDKVRELKNSQVELLKQGIAFSNSDYRYPTSYRFTGLNSVKPPMIEEATKNARAAAVKFAEDSDSKLGKIKTATQGQFSIEDRDESTPFIKKIRVVTYVEYFLKD